jgi:hypothetical protein
MGKFGGQLSNSLEMLKLTNLTTEKKVNLLELGL